LAQHLSERDLIYTDFKEEILSPDYADLSRLEIKERDFLGLEIKTFPTK